MKVVWISLAVTTTPLPIASSFVPSNRPPSLPPPPRMPTVLTEPCAPLRKHVHPVRRHDPAKLPALSLSSSSSASEEDPEGSLVGAALLFAGTAVGAGMLALPAETAPAGFVPSVCGLVFCWGFTCVTSLLTLEATWTVVRALKAEGGEGEDPDRSAVGFVSVSRRALGVWGERFTAGLFWFLLSAIVVAYAGEGGLLLSRAVSTSVAHVDPATGSVGFVAFFGSFAVFGTRRVDGLNRVLVGGFVAAFLGLVSVGLPSVHAGSLFDGAGSDWSGVYPGATSVGILAFGAQNVVPTLLRYLGGDAERTKKAILAGSLLPLVMYVVWEAVFFGLVPVDGANAAGEAIDIVTELGTYGGPLVKKLVELFSACAVGSSMAGASVSLVDFFQDALSESSISSESSDSRSATTPSAPTRPTAEEVPTRRLVAASFALIPPLFLACAFPDAFLGALENAGLIGGVSLYGIVPALAVLRLRVGTYREDVGEGEGEVSMPGKLPGGAPALCFVLAVSLALVLPELVRLAENFVAFLADSL